MDIAALNKAERLLNAAQNSMETLQQSAKNSDKKVFQKALDNFVSSMNESSQALSKVENLGASDIPAGFVSAVNQVLKTINQIEKDPVLRAQLAALNAPLILSHLQGFKATVSVTAQQLKALRRGERVAGIDEMQP